MEFHVTFRLNEKLYLKDPESSELGRKIVKRGIDIIYQLGFENFTFKKLAAEMGSTEATIYRYFENKHRLLLYILNWYWTYLAYLVTIKLQNVPDTKQQLINIIQLLTHELPESSGQLDYNKKFLNHIVITDSSKAYLVKDISEINKAEVFKPYKDLCARIADVIIAYDPNYQFPRSLSSTLIEASHHQQYFSIFMPKLTDVNPQNSHNYTEHFLTDLLFKTIGKC